MFVISNSQFQLFFNNAEDVNKVLPKSDKILAIISIILPPQKRLYYNNNLFYIKIILYMLIFF